MHERCKVRVVVLGKMFKVELIGKQSNRTYYISEILGSTIEMKFKEIENVIQKELDFIKMRFREESQEDAKTILAFEVEKMANRSDK